MFESRSVKIFDLAAAPVEVREADEFAALKPDVSTSDAVLTGIVVGQYEGGSEPPDDDPDSQAVTYSEYRLHLWLIDSGAERGETVLLRWTSEPRP